MKKTIAVDFDGVLSAYTGWKGEEHLGPPLPGAIEALRAYLNAGYQVVIFTTRADSDCSKAYLRNWLREAGLSEAETLAIGVTMLKPPAWLYIDDRCWLFKGTYPSPEQIEAFKPWWQT